MERSGRSCSTRRGWHRSHRGVGRFPSSRRNSSCWRRARRCRRSPCARRRDRCGGCMARSQSAVRLRPREPCPGACAVGLRVLAPDGRSVGLAASLLDRAGGSSPGPGWRAGRQACCRPGRRWRSPDRWRLVARRRARGRLGLAPPRACARVRASRADRGRPAPGRAADLRAVRRARRGRLARVGGRSHAGPAGLSAEGDVSAAAPNVVRGSGNGAQPQAVRPERGSGGSFAAAARERRAQSRREGGRPWLNQNR